MKRKSNEKEGKKIATRENKTVQEKAFQKGDEKVCVHEYMCINVCVCVCLNLFPQHCTLLSSNIMDSGFEFIQKHYTNTRALFSHSVHVHNGKRT